MIPLTLQLKNFLSYGSELQKIDFEPYSLICLSGKNGHGKSALLDAMTWAVWGQARKTNACVKADQGLLRLGQSHMMVIFDFICNENHYRIRREYSNTYSKSVVHLEFGVINKDTQSFIPLTEKTIKDTQYKIEQTLHLDFESFSNSAFLRQGNANEFSRKSSKDRKEVLATILGLNQYELLRKTALNKIKLAQTSYTTLRAFQEKIVQELTQKETILRNTLDLQKQENLLIQNEKKITKERSRLKEQYEELYVLQKKSELISFQIKNNLEKLEQGKSLLKEKIAHWKTTQYKKKELHALTDLELTKKTLINTVQEHQNALHATLMMKSRFLELKEKLQRIEQKKVEALQYKNTTFLLESERLNHEIATIIKKIEYSTLKIATLENDINILLSDIKKVEDSISPLEMIEKEISLHEKNLDKHKGLYQQLISRGNFLTIELKNLLQKKELTHNVQDPSCPLCEQNLTLSRRKFLKNRLEKVERHLKHQLERCTRILPRLKTALVNQHEQIQNLKKEQTQSTLAIQHLNHQKTTLNTYYKEKEFLTLELKKNLEEKNIYENRLKILLESNKKEHKDIMSSLDSKDQTEYSALEKQLEKTNYNEQAHKETINILTNVENELKKNKALLDALSQQKERAQEISHLCKQLKKEKIIIQQLYQELSTFDNLSTIKANLESKENILHNTYQQCIKNKEEIIELRTRSESELKRLENIEQESRQLETQINELTETIQDYQLIAQATGKDGIQALLIEDAIPEIEQEANYLLGKLTNNQAHISLESLRDLKSGGLKETLDIKISDAAGIRSYELFSGGEGFRIDFALRIAISKLLARRAGTTLQTLIIDEGFGSQDEDGLSHIMDAIYKIQEDFAKVIIVSHLPTLKDQFPVHFVIEKGAQGSKVSIVEHN